MIMKINSDSDQDYVNVDPNDSEPDYINVETDDSEQCQYRYYRTQKYAGL